ncbi:hypothetical protein [Marinobacter nauticus]|uniref:hypothetical protein n=1 Tax=Marinobacter nauticus TaxID=2743 RepID=UPI0037357574
MSSNTQQWHLIGNGLGKAEIRPNETLIRFNQSLSSSASSTLVVSNGRVKGINQPFLVEGQQPPHDFERRLNETSGVLESRLGVRPSAGLTTLLVLREEPCKIRISCMDLLPTIARPEHLSNRQPLACCYHNWLGERRIALPWAHKFDWPGFWLSEWEGAKLSQASDPYSALLSLPSIERQEGLRLIRWLAGLPHACWTTHATEDLLVLAEHLFFLKRGVRDTSNWWLFDFEASELMARIHHTLAMAQQYLLSPVQALPESL